MNIREAIDIVEALTYTLDIAESLDSTQQWKWIKSEIDSWIAEFSINGLQYHLIFDGVNIISIKFCAFPTLTINSKATIPDYGITKTGSAGAVFATVIEIMKIYIKQRSPKSFGFAAKKRIPSRVKLYRSLVGKLKNLVSGTYNFSEEDDGDYINFRFIK